MLRFACTLLRLAARAVVRPTGRLDLSGDFGRLIFSLLAFVGVAWAASYLLPSGEDWEIRATAGWDVGAAVYLGLTWVFVVRSTPEWSRRWATSQDAPRSRILQTVFGRVAGLGFVVVAGLIGLASGTGLVQPERSEGNGLMVTLSAVAVIEAWLVLQVSYGLRYAYLYYRGEGSANPGGLEFPGGEEPYLLDFAYFAFTIGTAFAVSDVRVSARTIRRVVIGYSVISFVYNAAILTLAFGIVLGNS